jgi:hypothetical protein
LAEDARQQLQADRLAERQSQRQPAAALRAAHVIAAVLIFSPSFERQ